tara:strand:+ start:2305 stop:2718 length:414 start_codon:yes stop_codon:yes gene_type:complete
MNDPISWHPSLVKKFSSFNHNKLLNQLRNEVKKYPLNNKKNKSTNQIKDIKMKSDLTYSNNNSLSNNSQHNSNTNTNQSTVNFNNAKNFSIYNNKMNNTINNDSTRQIEGKLPDQLKSKNDSSTLSFKERLNQIDMK